MIHVDDNIPVLDGKTSQLFYERNKYEEPDRYVYDYQLFEGETVIVNQGSFGIVEKTILTDYYNGNEIKQTVLDEDIVLKACPKVIHIGARKRPEYIIPVTNYTMSSYFGARWGRNHNGIDLAVPVGTPVASSTSGEVVRAGWFDGYGNCIDVLHGEDILIRYGHLSAINVSVGQKISQGELIGLSGNTGNSTGPHLHFEIRENDIPVNPFSYINLN